MLADRTGGESSRGGLVVGTKFFEVDVMTISF
jgi:hypothetical protein